MCNAAIGTLFKNLHILSKNVQCLTTPLRFKSKANKTLNS